MKQTFFKATKVFGILVAFYLLLGLVAYLVPDRPVIRNVEHSLAAGDLQENYPSAIIPSGRYQMDNYTDALILNQALHLRSEGLSSILLLPRYDEGSEQCRALAHYLAGDIKENHTNHYARYWHGSTFIARILLSFLSFMLVRNLLYMLSSLLLIWSIFALWQRVDKVTALAVAWSLACVSVFVMQFSLQYVQVLLIALAGILWMAYQQWEFSNPGWRTKCALLFFVMGSLTSYLDLITAPTFTLGLPLLVLVTKRNSTDFRQGATMVVSVALWWLAAYVLTWATKWGLASLLTGEDIFGDAYLQASLWSDNGANYIPTAFGKNIGKIRWIYVIIPLVLLIVSACRYPQKQRWGLSTQYLLVALIPLVYFLLMPHPAAHHSVFNYRALAPLIGASFLAASVWVDWPRLIQKLKRNIPTLQP